MPLQAVATPLMVRARPLLVEDTGERARGTLGFRLQVLKARCQGEGHVI